MVDSHLGEKQRRDVAEAPDAALHDLRRHASPGWFEAERTEMRLHLHALNLEESGRHPGKNARRTVFLLVTVRDDV